MTGSSVNYAFSGLDATATYTVKKAPITITAPQNLTKVYDGAAYALTADQAEVEGRPADGDTVNYSLTDVSDDKDVNDYQIDVTADVTANPNYDITVKSGSLTITPNTTGKVTVGNSGKVYDGTTTTDYTKFKVTLPEDAVAPEQWLAEDFNVENIGSDVASYTYTLSAKGIDKLNKVNTNYVFDAADITAGKYEITKAPVTITAPQNLTKVYDGTAYELTADQAEVKGQPTDGDAVNYSLTDVSDDKDVNNYQIDVTADAKANPNYDITVKSGSLTITPSTTGQVTVENSGKVYDGTTATDYIKFKVTLPEDAVAPEQWSAEDFNVDTIGSDAGSYTYKLSAKGIDKLNDANTNYVFDEADIAAGQYEITKAPITITAPNVDHVYDGTAYDLTADQAEVKGQPADGDAINYSLTDVSGDKDVNEYAIDVTADVDANPNYAITVKSGSLTITPSTTGKVTVENSGKVYDGTTATDYTKFKVTLPEDAVTPDQWSAEDFNVDDIKANAGSYTYTLSAKGIAKLNDANTNYVFDEADIAAGKYEITKAPITITAPNVDHVYDGTAYDLTADQAEVKGRPADGDTVNYSLTDVSGDKDVNEYAIDVTADVDANPNYAITVKSGSLTITPNTTGKVTVENSGKVYDGTTATDYTKFKVTLPEDAVIPEQWAAEDFDVENIGSDVASYTYTLSAKGIDKLNKVNTNYVFDAADIITGKYEITKAPITITAPNVDKVYDGAAYNLTANQAEVKGQPTDGDAVNYSLTDVSEDTDVNDYTISVDPEVDANPNYEITITPGTLSITKAPINSVTLNPGTKTYDGQSIVATGNQPTLTFAGVNDDQTAVTLDGTTDYTYVPAETADTNYATVDGIHAGTYTITLTAAGLKKLADANLNYDFTNVELAQVATTTYTVTQAPTTGDEATQIKVNPVTISKTTDEGEADETTDLSDALAVQVGNELTVDSDGLRLSDFKFVQSGKTVQKTPTLAGTYVISLTDAAKATIAASQNYALADTDWLNGILTIKQVANDPNNPGTSTDVTVGENGTVTDVDQKWDNGESTQVKVKDDGSISVTDTTKDGDTDTADLGKGDTTELNGSTTVTNNGSGSVDMSQTDENGQTAGVTIDGSDGSINHYHDIEIDDAVGEPDGKIALTFDGDHQNTLTYIHKIWPNGEDVSIERDASSHELTITQVTATGDKQVAQLSATGASTTLGDLMVTNEDGVVTLTQIIPATDQAGAGLLQAQITTTQDQDLTDNAPQAQFLKHATTVGEQTTASDYFETTSIPDPTGNGSTKITTDGNGTVTTTDKVWPNGDETKVSTDEKGNVTVEQTPNGGTTSGPVEVTDTVTLPGSDNSTVTVSKTNDGVSLKQTITDGDNTHSTGETIPKTTATPATVTPSEVHEETVTKDPSGGTTTITTDETGKTTEIDKTWPNGDVTKVVTDTDGGVTVTQTPNGGTATTETVAKDGDVTLPGSDGSSVKVTNTDGGVSLAQTVPTDNGGTTGSSATIAKTGDATSLTVTPENTTENTVTKDPSGGTTTVITDENGKTKEIDKTWPNGDVTAITTTTDGGVSVTQTPKDGEPTTETVESGKDVTLPGTDGSTVKITNTDNGVALHQTVPTGDNGETTGTGEVISKAQTDGSGAVTVTPTDTTEDTVTKDPSGGTTTVTTDENGKTKEITKTWPNGDVTTVTTDTEGNVSVTQTPKDGAATTENVPAGDDVTLPGTDGSTVEVSNSEGGVALHQTVPAGDNGETTGTGETISKTGEDLTVTPENTTEDTVTKDPSGGTTTVTTDENGKTKEITKTWPNGDVTTVTTDTEGNVTVTQTPKDGEVTTKTVEPGKDVELPGSDGSTVKVTDTDNGVALHQTVPTGDNGETTGIGETISKTGEGLTVTPTDTTEDTVTKDPSGGTTTVTTDENGKTKEITKTWPNGDVTTVTTDTEGNVTVTQTPKDGEATTETVPVGDDVTLAGSDGSTVEASNSEGGVALHQTVPTGDSGETTGTGESISKTGEGTSLTVTPTDTTEDTVTKDPSGGTTTVTTDENGKTKEITKTWPNGDVTTVVTDTEGNVTVTQTPKDGEATTENVPAGDDVTLPGTDGSAVKVTNTDNGVALHQTVPTGDNGETTGTGETISKTGEGTSLTVTPTDTTEDTVTKDPSGGTTTVTTDENGKTKEITKTWPNGDVTTVVTDTEGNVTVTQTPKDGEPTTENVPAGNDVTLAGSDGSTVKVTNTDNGVALHQTVPTSDNGEATGTGETISKTGEGTSLTVTPTDTTEDTVTKDPSGGTTTVTTDENGKTKEITKTWPNGDVTTVTTDTEGNVTVTQTPKDGAATTKTVEPGNDVTLPGSDGSTVKVTNTDNGVALHQTTPGSTTDETTGSSETIAKAGEGTSLTVTPTDHTEDTVTTMPNGSTTTVTTDGAGATQTIDKVWPNGDEIQVVFNTDGGVSVTTTLKGGAPTTETVGTDTKVDIPGTDGATVTVANTGNGVRLTQTVPTANGNTESTGETVEKAGDGLNVSPSDTTKQTVTKDPNGGQTTITQDKTDQVLNIQKVWHDQTETAVTVQADGSYQVTTTDANGKQTTATVAQQTTADVGGVTVDTTTDGQITLQYATGTGAEATTQTNTITMTGELTFKRTNADPNGGQSEVTRTVAGNVTHIHRNWLDGDESDVTLTENEDGTTSVVYAENSDGIHVYKKFLVDATSTEATAGKSALTVTADDQVSLTHDYDDDVATQQDQQVTNQGDSTYALTVTDPAAGVTTVEKTQTDTITAVHKVWTNNDKTDVTLNADGSADVVQTTANGKTETKTVNPGETENLGSDLVFTTVTNPTTTEKTIQLNHVVLENAGDGHEDGEVVDNTGDPTYTKGVITTDPNGGVSTVTTNEGGAVVQIDKTWGNGTHSTATIDPDTKVTTVTQTTPAGVTKTETVKPGETAKLDDGGTGHVEVTTNDNGETKLTAVTDNSKQTPIKGQEVSATGDSIFTETKQDPNGGTTKVAKNAAGTVLGITKTWSNGDVTEIVTDPATGATTVNGTTLTDTPVALANGITISKTTDGVQLQQTNTSTSTGETITTTGQVAYTKASAAEATSTTQTTEKHQDPNGGVSAVTTNGNGDLVELQKTWPNGTVTTVTVNPTTGVATVNGETLTQGTPTSVDGVTITATDTGLDLAQGSNGETVTNDGQLAYRKASSAPATSTSAEDAYTTTMHQDPNGGTTTITTNGNGEVTKVAKTWGNGIVTNVTRDPKTNTVTVNGETLTQGTSTSVNGVTITATDTGIDLVQGNNGETVSTTGAMAYHKASSAPAVSVTADDFYQTATQTDQSTTTDSEQPVTTTTSGHEHATLPTAQSMAKATAMTVKVMPTVKVTPATAPTKHTAPTTKATAATLPQTGETATPTLAGLGLSLLTATLGLVGLKRRKKDRS